MASVVATVEEEQNLDRMGRIDGERRRRRAAAMVTEGETVRRVRELGF